jgi:protein-disulfide isomerase
MTKIFAIFAALSILSTDVTAEQEAPFADKDRAKIEEVIKNYLLNNPEVIETAIVELNRRRTLARMLPSIELYRGYLENDPDAAVLGNPEGDVTIVEFFDYRCGFCRRHFGEVLRLVEADGNIRWVPRHYPILDRPNEQPLSLLAARAAEAAHKQGKFKEFHIALMGKQNGFDLNGLYELAGSIGLDVNRLKADMNDKLLDKRIRNSLAIGNDIGFTGTPGYIIGEDVVLGAEGHGRLLEAVARARSAKKTASAD